MESELGFKFELNELAFCQEIAQGLIFRFFLMKKIKYVDIPIYFLSKENFLEVFSTQITESLNNEESQRINKDLKDPTLVGFLVIEGSKDDSIRFFSFTLDKEEQKLDAYSRTTKFFYEVLRLLDDWHESRYLKIRKK